MNVTEPHCYQRIRYIYPALLACFIGILASHATEEDAGLPEAEVQTLRERLTEREDEMRVEDPWVIDILDRPLSILGQYEIAIEFFNQLSFGFSTNYGQRLLEQEVELELFYPLHDWVTLFAQVKFGMEEELDRDNPDQLSGSFVERGEMWIFIAEDPEDAPFSFEIGRLEFEDDRLWWWDEDLDAVRLALDGDALGIELSIAEERFPNRSDQDHIDPEQEDVRRLLAEGSWDWAEDQEIGIFFLRADDRSSTEREGAIVSTDREDESDADLEWHGIRAQGAVDMGGLGGLAYWLDAARIHGNETIIEFGDGTESEEGGEDEDGEEDEKAESSPPLPRGKSLVSGTVKQRVRGWGYDLGATWLMPMPGDPRLTLAYARASGDKSPGSRSDRAYRQTGLQGNEPGFGGVERFSGYGNVLDPELSNLSIMTIGLGVSILDNSSIDLVFHEYTLLEHAEELRDARIDAELTGIDREIGRGIDLIASFKEWDTAEFLVSMSMFETGDAFGLERGEWIYGNFYAFRIAF